jgi:predicted DsbA family dithiol-disulfide isomerase
MSAEVVIPQLAKHIGVSQKRIRTCVDDEKTASAVASAKSEFASFGFVGTPTVMLVDERTMNAVALSGVAPLDYYGTAVALLLANESSRK